MFHAFLSFPLAHWRGEVSFWPTLALTLIGLRGLIFALGGIPSVTIDVIVLIWQITGTLRAISHSQHDRPDLMSALMGYTAIAICLPLTALPHLDRVSRNVLDMLPGEEVAETGLRLVPTYAVLEGAIDFSMFTALEKALAEHPELTSLELNSDGGRVFAARAIVRVIDAHGLDTHVEGTCASACTLIFVAGTRRSLAARGRLGFHGYRQDVYVQSVIPDEEEARDRAAFLARGIAAGFVSRVFETNPEEMWYPSREELDAAGVTNAP